MKYGIPPPAGMAREFIAAWYWSEVQRCDEAHQDRHIQGLILGAMEADVSGHLIPVAGFTQPQPLSSLLAPYRTREGGLAEREEAARRRVLDAGPGRWNRA